MKDRKLAIRYARALLGALGDPEVAGAADQFLHALSQAISDSPELRAVLVDPAVSRDSRLGVLRSLAQQHGLPPRMTSFFATVVDHGRTGLLPAIAAVYHEERERQLGIVPAEITTARPMLPEQRQRAERALAHLTGQQVRLECKIDPALIGGALTRVGSVLYDGSVRTHLVRLRRRMVQE